MQTTRCFARARSGVYHRTGAPAWRHSTVGRASVLAVWQHARSAKPFKALPELAQAGNPADLSAAEAVLSSLHLENLGLLGSLEDSHATINSVLDLFSNLKEHLMGTPQDMMMDSSPLHSMHASLAAGDAAPLHNTVQQAAIHAQTAAEAHANMPLHETATAAAQHIDTVVNSSSDATRDSLGMILNSASDALETKYQGQEQQVVTGFVLTFNQLLSALHLPFAGGVASFEAMEVTQNSLTAAAEATSTGIDMVVKITLGALALAVACIPHAAERLKLDDPTAELPQEYSVPGLEEYFSKKPIKVLRRNAQVLREVGSFSAALLADWANGKLQENEVARADDLCRRVESLGPAYVKIAQSMSTRVDMLSPAYLDAFKRLQDRVKPFSNQEAREVLEEGLGLEVDSVFEWLSESPMAAASLGQVYKGKLQPAYGGHYVAVKVQRPHILENVSLDIFIMRRVALIFSLMPGMNSEWAGVLDGWAERFFQEMDYNREAQNTMLFAKNIVDYQMEGITVANVFPQLVSRSVMVTEWVAGAKLTSCADSDVEDMCRALLNCYLVQLLETGFLHADPHPGNLMVMPDGKICILDFGLVTEIPEGQRVLLVEYIAHLTAEDWDAVARDLEGFGFFPDGLPEEAMDIITPILAKLMGSLVNGGGIGKTFSLSMVGELDFAARQFQMVVPSYFGLILRAFSTIEGMALSVNPDFSMIQECLPYLLRRLLSDSNPRMQQALRTLLYGNGKHVDVKRLTKICSTLGLFTKGSVPQGSRAMGPTFAAAVSSEEMVKGKAPSRSQVEQTTAANAGIMNDKLKDAIRLMFKKDGSYAQELLADELVAAVDALSKAALGEALRMVVASGGAKAAQRHAEALGPFRALLFPLPLPNDIMFTMQPMVSLSSEDHEVLGQLRSVLDMPSGASVKTIHNRATNMMQVVTELVPMMPEIMPGVQFTLERTTLLLLQRILYRLTGEEDPQEVDKRVAEAMKNSSWSSAGFGSGPGMVGGMSGGSAVQAGMTGSPGVKTRAVGPVGAMGMTGQQMSASRSGMTSGMAGSNMTSPGMKIRTSSFTAQPQTSTSGATQQSTAMKAQSDAEYNRKQGSSPGIKFRKL